MEIDTVQRECIYSTLGDDPDLGEIVELFVEEMPARMAALTSCRDAQDWQQLGRLAHQLKGACGSYGFAQLTAQAARLEKACRCDEPTEEQMLAELQQMLSMCSRVRSGAPPKS